MTYGAAFDGAREATPGVNEYTIAEALTHSPPRHPHRYRCVLPLEAIACMPAPPLVDHAARVWDNAAMRLPAHITLSTHFPGIFLAYRS
jgi:hypothetical protein